MKKRTKKGFTLIELIVVIVILAVLSAVAIPVVTGMVTDANTAAAEANARTLELGVKAVMTEKNLAAATTVTEAEVLGFLGLTEADLTKSGDYDIAVAANGAVTASDHAGTADGTISGLQ